MSRRETNPHFSRPPPRPHQEDQQQPPIIFVPASEHHGQFPPPSHGVPPMQQEDPPYHPHFPLQPRPQEHPYPLRPQRQEPPPPPPISKAPRRDKRSRPQQQPPPPPPEGRRKRQEELAYPPSKQKVKIREPSSPKPPLVPTVLPPLTLSPEPRQQLYEPHSHNPKQRHAGPRHHRPWLPPPKKSNPLTWCGAVLCVIFWLIIIIGGLIVLIVYLVFRPQSPNFEVSSVTLNAAYLDFGYLLNADITILANFTNPNKKVHIDFSTVTIYLYYGNTLIATQYVEPFSAARAQSRFAYIHMVTSQVQLPLGESQRIVKQMESNGVLLGVRGVFRARSKLGTILRYSYNLYGLCNVMVTRPPDGVLLKKKCRTKR